MECDFHFLLIKPNSQRPTDDEQLRHTCSTSFYYQPKTKNVSLNSLLNYLKIPNLKTPSSPSLAVAYTSSSQLFSFKINHLLKFNFDDRGVKKNKNRW